MKKKSFRNYFQKKKKKRTDKGKKDFDPSYHNPCGAGRSDGGGKL